MTTKKKKPAKKKTAKKKAVKKSANAVTVPTRASVTKFIDSVENETRREDAKTLLALMKKVTGDRPVMWGPSIVGFGQYHYKYDSGREGDFMLVGFSPRKANMVLYVLGCLGGDEPLLKKLGKHKHGVSCLYVNKLDDIDLGVLEKLVKKSYETTSKRWS